MLTQQESEQIAGMLLRYSEFLKVEMERFVRVSMPIRVMLGEEIDLAQKLAAKVFIPPTK